MLVDNNFLAGLGIVSVIIGIVLIVLNISLRRLIQKQGTKNPAEKPKVSQQEISVVFPNQRERQKFIAAVSASIAATMGVDVDGLRIHSIRKVS